MRWTFSQPKDERREGGRRSRVVLMPRRWHQAFAGSHSCASDGGKRARFTGESTKETVKTIAQGRPGVTGEPVVTTLVCFITFAREAAGAWAPGFPCALYFEGRQMSLPASDAIRAARMKRHEPWTSLRAERSNPESQRELDRFVALLLAMTRRCSRSLQNDRYAALRNFYWDEIGAARHGRACPGHPRLV